MKKIGVITINGNYNYGNRLQNYALEKVINSLGYHSETIVFPQKRDLKQKLKKIKNFFNGTERARSKDFNKMIDVKSKAFESFQKNYLNNVCYEDLNLLNDFDRFIVGSDQVWNPSWKLIDEYWLRFTSEEKRFSYAASMATNVVHKSNTKKLPKYLKEMNEISVREKESINLIKSISGRKASVVLDPTMLLTKEHYNDLIANDQNTRCKFNSQYIMVYALTGLDPVMERKLKKYAEKNNLKLIYVMGNYYHSDHLALSPLEFLEGIKNAELIISDSFHCGVFSIIFEKQFILFNRNDGQLMNERMTTLLSKFNLMNRAYDGKNFEQYGKIDYDLVSKKLESERLKSLEYLNFILSKSI